MSRPYQELDIVRFRKRPNGEIRAYLNASERRRAPRKTCICGADGMWVKSQGHKNVLLDIESETREREAPPLFSYLAHFNVCPIPDEDDLGDR